MFLKFTKKYVIQIQDFSQPAQTPQMSEKFMQEHYHANLFRNTLNHTSLFPLDSQQACTSH